MTGKGKFKWYDGRQYKGYFKNGKFDGKGSLKQNGKSTKGIWEKGKLCDSPAS